MKLRFPQTVFASLTAVALAAAAVLAGGQAIAAKPTATPTPKSSNAANKADSASSKSAETGKPVDAGKPAESGQPADSGKPVETGKPSDAGKPSNVGKPSEAGKPGTAADNGPKAAYIVRFAEGTNVASEAANLAKSKVTVGKKFGHVFKGLVAELTEKQKAALDKRPGVVSIVPDAAVTADETQLSAPWGLDRIDQADLPLGGTYGYTSAGLGVTAYVVDTGIRASHQDFNSRVVAGYTAITDGIGTADCNGHGTHVASTIGGTNYGAAKSVKLVPVRVLDCAGSGTMSGVIAGLDWVAQNHPVNTPAVVNMSLGGGANSSLDTAVNALINRGITVVVAAGNSSADACNYSPARVPGAITVAATTSTDGFASYSNFGSCVDIAAPGTSITAAWFGSDSETRTISGTSMATPHVAGVVARQLALGNQLPASISSALANAASKNKISGLPSATANLLLFASATDSSEQPVAVTPPVAASGLVAEGAVKSAKLSWVLGDNTASPLTSQTVRLWANNQLVKTYNVGTSTTTITPTKLRGGVSYYFTVLAVSANGVTESSRSNSVLVTNK